MPATTVDTIKDDEFVLFKQEKWVGAEIQLNPARSADLNLRVAPRFSDIHSLNEVAFRR